MQLSWWSLQQDIISLPMRGTWWSRFDKFLKRQLVFLAQYCPKPQYTDLQVQCYRRSIRIRGHFFILNFIFQIVGSRLGETIIVRPRAEVLIVHTTPPKTTNLGQANPHLYYGLGTYNPVTVKSKSFSYNKIWILDLFYTFWFSANWHDSID